MKKVISGIICCSLFAISGCVKQATYPDYPILTSISVAQTSYSGLFANNNGSDSTLVTLGFTDGEGGIGPASLSSDPDTLVLCNHAYDALAISDPFYNVYYYEYHASHISTDSCLNYIQTAYVPDNAHNLAIKGTIQIYPSIECPPTGNVDTIYFSCFIKDRNGKVSNRLRTPPIIITCQ